MNGSHAKSAVLTLDFQQGIIEMNAGAQGIIPMAAAAADFAREKKLLLIHVGIGFSEGYPEAPDHSMFSTFKEKQLFIKGSPSATFDPAIVQPDEIIVHKRRFGAFSGSKLETILRSQRIDCLILFGISTSGIVLSTVRHAFDLDYRITVLHDACYDRDAEVHRVLTEKVFPKQAKVQSVQEFINDFS